MRSFNCSFPHTTHCLATGEIMISTMGDKEENGKGDFVLIDSNTLKVTGETRTCFYTDLVKIRVDFKPEMFKFISSSLFLQVLGRKGKKLPNLATIFGTNPTMMSCLLLNGVLQSISRGKFINYYLNLLVYIFNFLSNFTIKSSALISGNKHW